MEEQGGGAKMDGGDQGMEDDDVGTAAVVAQQMKMMWAGPWAAEIDHFIGGRRGGNDENDEE